jgi:hypothetical protein
MNVTCPLPAQTAPFMLRKVTDSNVLAEGFDEKKDGGVGVQTG